MSIELIDDVAAFEKAFPRGCDCPVLTAVEQSIDDEGRFGISIHVDMARAYNDAADIVPLRFRCVSELRIDWTQWLGQRVEALTITDVTDRDLERIRYLVWDAHGGIHFYCEGFTATLPEIA